MPRSRVGWILRWAKDEDQLDLQDPRFADAVADIGSAIRGVPKDELASEEVRQHRRTVRMAWLGGLTLAGLAVLAGLLAVQSSNNAAEAERQAAVADASAAAEAEARESAEANASEAEMQAARARARELGVASLEALELDPELATLLALEAIATTGSVADQPEAVRNALWRSVQADHLARVVPTDVGVAAQIAIGPADDRLAIAGDANVLVMYSLPDYTELWRKTEETVDSFVSVAFSPDGTRVSLTIADSTSDFWSSASPPDSEPSRVEILDAATGRSVYRLEYPNCRSAYGWGWSPDGSEYLLSSGFDLCERDGTSGTWVEVLDGGTFESQHLFDYPEPNQWLWPSFAAAGEVVILGAFTDAHVRSGPEYSEVRVLSGAQGGGTVSPDGTVAVTFDPSSAESLVLRRTADGERVDILKPLPAFPSLPDSWGFSPDGDRIAMTTEGRSVNVWSTTTGDLQFELPGGARGWTPTFDSTGERLFTVHAGGVIREWDLRTRTLGETVVAELRPDDHIQGNTFSIGPTRGAMEVIDLAEFGPRVVLFDPASGSLLNELEGYGRPLAVGDGRFLAMRNGAWFIHDPDSETSTLFAGCVSSDSEPPFLCDDSGEPQPTIDVVASLDGTEVLVVQDDALSFYDVGAGEVTSSRAAEIDWATFGGFSKDWIVGWATSDLLIVTDRETGAERLRLESSAVEFEFSHDRKVLVVASEADWR